MDRPLKAESDMTREMARMLPCEEGSKLQKDVSKERDESLQEREAVVGKLFRG